MVAYPIAEGTFAIFIHRGPIEKIGDTVGEIYRTWLPQSGYQHGGFDVELYDHRFQIDSDESEMEYWIAITPATANES